MNIFDKISTLFRPTNIISIDGNNSAGKKGETIACIKLKKKGYKVLEKNFRTKYGEIDIIAEQDNTICFIEVKARSSNYHGNPEEFVTKRKQQKLWRAASIYISRNSLEIQDYRFDIISVNLSNNSSNIFKNAFVPDY